MPAGVRIDLEQGPGIGGRPGRPSVIASGVGHSEAAGKRPWTSATRRGNSVTVPPRWIRSFPAAALRNESSSVSLWRGVAADRGDGTGDSRWRVSQVTPLLLGIRLPRHYAVSSGGCADQAAQCLGEPLVVCQRRCTPARRCAGTEGSAGQSAARAAKGTPAPRCDTLKQHGMERSWPELESGRRPGRRAGRLVARRLGANGSHRPDHLCRCQGRVPSAARRNRGRRQPAGGWCRSARASRRVAGRPCSRVAAGTPDRRRIERAGPVGRLDEAVSVPGGLRWPHERRSAA